jgi:nucleoid-associated protein YgaU
MRRTLPLIAILAAEGGAVLLLYRLLREPGLAYPLAFGIAAWLLGSHLLYLGARAAGIPVAIRAAAQVTLPVLRRRVDRALAASVVTGALVVSGSPALAGAAPSPDPLVDVSVQVAEPAPEPTPAGEPIREPIDPVIDPVIEEVTVPVRSGRAGDPSAVVDTLTTPLPPMEPATKPTPEPKGAEPKGGEPTRTSPAKTRPPEPPAPAATEPALVVAPVVTPAATATSYTVVAGDSFWEIAARHVASATGRDRISLTPGEIHGAWVRMCDANRVRIRSGDVNLIYPGEVVDLPAI